MNCNPCIVTKCFVKLLTAILRKVTNCVFSVNNGHQEQGVKRLLLFMSILKVQFVAFRSIIIKIILFEAYYPNPDKPEL